MSGGRCDCERAKRQCGPDAGCALGIQGEQNNLRRTYRRFAFALSRLLANCGAEGSTPLIERFKSPPQPEEKRWLDGFYIDTPQEWDDPYRFFRW
jgi:hypothetical protein